jgi:uncharacterized membrane protein
MNTIHKKHTVYLNFVEIITMFFGIAGTFYLAVKSGPIVAFILPISVFGYRLLWIDKKIKAIEGKLKELDTLLREFRNDFFLRNIRKNEESE